MGAMKEACQKKLEKYQTKWNELYEEEDME